MKTRKTSYLPKDVHWFSVNDSETLVVDLTERIRQLLTQSIDENGRASMAVSGGRTPVDLFEAVSKLKLDWSKVDLTLVDERWVEVKHKDSNESLVKKHLMKNNASKVSFTSLMGSSKSAKDGQAECEKSLQSIKQPFDVIILGMGNDGHTASLFPCCEELNEAMDPSNSQRCIATTPKNAPYERMSLTYAAIKSAKNLILHLNGSDKLTTLELAMSCKDAKKMPIFAFIEKPLEIYCSP